MKLDKAIFSDTNIIMNRDCTIPDYECNSQEEFRLPPLGLDAVGGGEPLAGHVDHRDLYLVLGREVRGRL